ncbi:MAG: DUF2194 domain-containing protein [Lachnospiraceae bacterium]|nr:DUF2194 domain-containing protein [Lachnospiraceae bacterium]
MKHGKIKVLIPLLALVFCMVVVLMEQNGVMRKYTNQVPDLQELTFTEPLAVKTDCLLLVNSEERSSVAYQDMLELLLEQMKIPYDEIDLSDENIIPELDQYSSIIMGAGNWTLLTKVFPDIYNWVEAGGGLLAALPPAESVAFEENMDKLGILKREKGYVSLDGFHILDESMLGTDKNHNLFYFDQITGESIQTSMNVELDDKSQVYVKSIDDTVSVLWSRDYGEGRFVVLNDTITDKYQRGFLATAYSLLHDVSIYPVINASAFYLDDFPSPVPEGDSEYVERDYGVNTATFYSTIWWPEVFSWEKTYGIKHTGMIIENYSDETEPPFAENLSTKTFVTNGNMLLNNGGELGFHGYNHMPLCLAGVDDNKKFGSYKLWKTEESMEASLKEVHEFSAKLFPDTSFNVYVPPSNIISNAGIEALQKACPDIEIVASTYFCTVQAPSFEQEFGVAENNLIYTPRITSGCNIDDYQKLSAMTELNFHYVQSHFLHPDDALDEDRGAVLGWEKLSTIFKEGYLDWLQETVPDIRKTTGTQMGEAVLRYSKLNLETEVTDSMLQGKIGGFSNEAYFMLRLQKQIPLYTDGCTCEHITGDLYLVQATSPEFTINLEEK